MGIALLRYDKVLLILERRYPDALYWNGLSYHNLRLCGDTVVFSEGEYHAGRWLKKTDAEEKVWRFSLARTEISITPGCLVSTLDGGGFSISMETGESSYSAGETATIDILLSDSFDHPVCQSWIYTPPDYPDAEEQMVVYRGQDEGDLDKCTSHYVMPYPENNPTLTVTEPDGTVFLTESSYELFCYYEFTLPGDASPGIWTVRLSFDTGPHQGVIQDTTTFAVGIPGDVNDDGKVNMADVMILWYDIADYPSPGAWEVNCCE